MTRIEPKAIETASLTDVGRRRASNQDAFGGLVTAAGARLLIVADGMGGHAGGATASRLAVEAIESFVEHSQGDPAALLRGALEEANRRVYAEARKDPDLSGMGTTGVALLFQPDGSAWVAHVGDSRAYRLRDGALEPLTADHSLVAELERGGMITAEEARVHPRRNEVLRCIGVDPEVDVDVAPVEIEPGDQYLLCSDGLSGVLCDDEIAAELLRSPPELAVRRLVEAANECGGPDNITVQIAHIPAAPRAKRREGRAPRRWHLSPPLLVAAALLVALLAAALLWGR
ncbi:MAG TPA: Stp1/IreP family PP2C-type Ser/Thr phosphatase [Myxococcota bacterium]